MSENNILEWISNWYGQNCNGDWEHDFGMTIETLDNPGWSISIDTEGTDVILPDKSWFFKENSSYDWYGFKIFDGKFQASGDFLKLSFLLNLFKSELEKQIEIKNSI